MLLKVMEQRQVTFLNIFILCLVTVGFGSVTSVDLGARSRHYRSIVFSIYGSLTLVVSLILVQARSMRRYENESKWDIMYFSSFRIFLCHL